MKKLISILCFGLFFVGGVVFAKEVMINPITPDIRDKLRESTDLVSKVEDSLAGEVITIKRALKEELACKRIGPVDCCNDKDLYKKSESQYFRAVGFIENLAYNDEYLKTVR
ncbi:MAG: hypothetical protein JRE64_27920 [Deltaproteobacteria bacterium]|nr:hypothetical protein [Deltaproteobacteria bacterium]